MGTASEARGPRPPQQPAPPARLAGLRKPGARALRHVLCWANDYYSVTKLTSTTTSFSHLRTSH
jgi:hypothetical protein